MFTNAHALALRQYASFQSPWYCSRCGKRLTKNWDELCTPIALHQFVESPQAFINPKEAG